MKESGQVASKCKSDIWKFKMFIINNKTHLCWHLVSGLFRSFLKTLFTGCPCLQWDNFVNELTFHDRVIEMFYCIVIFISQMGIFGIYVWVYTSSFQICYLTLYKTHNINTVTSHLDTPRCNENTAIFRVILYKYKVLQL